MKRIYIVGCARTRTTFVRNLFWAFENTFVFPVEMPLRTLIGVTGKEYNFVVQRNSGGVFSNKIPAWRVLRDMRRIRTNNITVINVTRNKRDTLNSLGGYVSEKRWNACATQARKWGGLIDLTIDSDKILASARELDSEQRRVADTLKLTSSAKWSDYPAFMPGCIMSIPSDLPGHKLRPPEYRP